MPAQATAKSVIASAKRLIEVRQFCRKSSRIAEISVPAWPMPIHQTKLTIAKPQATGMLRPQIPTPLVISQVIEASIIMTTQKATPIAAEPPAAACRPRTMPEIRSVIEAWSVPAAGSPAAA